MTEQRLKQIFDMSSKAWKWFKMKDTTDVSKRNDFYWECTTQDIKDAVKNCNDKSLKPFYTELLNVYAGQLQRDYLEYLGTKQEKLPL